MQNSWSPQLDTTRKLIIKVALGDDIRRIPIHNEDITYDELVLMMQRVYRGKLSTNDDVTIKYKDEDGDLITIFDSSDLSFAIQSSGILKITLFVGEAKSLSGSAELSGVRRELQDIRDRVIDLLDRLESSPLVGATQGLSLADGIAGKSDATRESPLSLSNGVKTVSSAGGKEFDPLKSQVSNESTQNKVMASFGSSETSAPPHVSQSYDRAATPDSISSVGSSASNQVKTQQNVQNQFAPSADQQQQTQQQQTVPQQPAQQQVTSSAYPTQSGYGMTHPGQMQQMYAGQPGYSTPQVPGQPSAQVPPQQSSQLQQQQQQPAPPQQQQHPSSSQQPPQQSGYDAGMYNNYGYPNAAGQPLPGQGMYQQASNPYGQAPGMPQLGQPKAPTFTPGPQGPPQSGQSPGNPYSRGAPTYSTGYPRPSAGYPQ